MKVKKPYAITMWDYSWLERRWDGAGYEDWDKALDELVARGYDAVRIDAYPLFIWLDAQKTWGVMPRENQSNWGSPIYNEIQVQPNLNIFMQKCADRGIMVGLSSWFRQDVDNSYEKISTPEDLAMSWKATLDSIPKELHKSILYVDLINELPIKVYTPFLPDDIDRSRANEPMQMWMRESIAKLREYYPEFDYTFSSAILTNIENEDVSYMDFIEPHIWMSSEEFYDSIGFTYEKFNPGSYEVTQKYAYKAYADKPEYWQKNLKDKIDRMVKYSISTGKPVITTECWAVTIYKDYPLFEWGWIKELCALGTKLAAQSGRWTAISTSNFCGPQFKGMWRDVEWHKKMTSIIKNSKLDRDFLITEGE